LVERELALLDPVLGLLYLLVALPHLFLQFGFLAQELVLYLEQFLLLDYLRFLLGRFLCLACQGLPLRGYDDEIPCGGQYQEEYHAGRQSDNYFHL